MNIQIIVGSTRTGRVSDRVAEWVQSTAAKLENTTVELVDLADYELPMFNEAIPPRYNPERQPTGNLKRWLDKLATADGYVIVTPEYNRAMPSVLKNAIDYVDFQMDGKPVALVAHGSTGGAQAVASLRMALPGVNAMTVPAATFLVGRAADMISESGQLSDELAANPYGPAVALNSTLDSLVWYTKALSAAR